MKSDNFVVIQGWFCNELNLKGNELLVFALIYGFCQDGQSVYSGGRKYIADTFNISLKTVDNTLQSLIEQELIVKHSSNDFIHPDIYTVYGDKETLVGREKITLGVAKNFPQGSEKITPNNIDKNIVKKDSNFTNVKLEQSTTTLKTPLIKTETSNDIATPTSNKKKKNRWEQCVDEINKFTDNEELREVLTTYLKMRLEMTPIFRGQWLGLLNNLKKLSGDTATQIEIVQQSINRGYKGFFEVKTYNKTYKGGQDKSVFSEYGQVKSIHSNEEAMNVQF